jgi:hypothetical protein
MDLLSRTGCVDRICHRHRHLRLRAYRLLFRSEVLAMAMVTALRIARAYLIDEAGSDSVWSSRDNAKAVAAIDAALSGSAVQRGNVMSRDEATHLVLDLVSAVRDLESRYSRSNREDYEALRERVIEALTTSPLHRDIP